MDRVLETALRSLASGATAVDLRRSNVGEQPQSTQLLADFLRGNTTVESLDLGENCIDAHGAEQLAAAVICSTVLYVTWNVVSYHQ